MWLIMITSMLLLSITGSNQTMDLNFYCHPSRHCEHVKMLLSLQHAVALNNSGNENFYFHPSLHCEHAYLLLLPKHDLAKAAFMNTTCDFFFPLSSFHYF
jgi:hypothetical protein